MFKSYLKTAVRNLRRDRVPSVINVVGLSIALASCIVVYLFLQVYYSLDTSHAHGDRIVIAETVEGRGEQATTWGTTPLALGPALAAELPHVERAARVVWEGGDVRTAEHAFGERIAFADPAFFEVFSFPLRAGSPAALADPDAAILSDETARKYFGDAEPLGQRLTLTVGDAMRTVTVGGVAAPFPNNASLRFEVLLPLAAHPSADAASWADTGHTFLLLRDPGDLAAVAASAARFVAPTNAATGTDAAERFAWERLTDPAPDGHLVQNRPAEAPHPALSLIMVGLAAFMLALSCFNYVNIALGSAARRLNEIGVRKVMGGTKRSLIAQFMTENLLLCALALAVGIGIARLFLVPLFNQTFVLDVSLSLVEDWGLWVFLAGLLAFVAVVSGAYPAFYVASFSPADVLRGRRQLAEKRWLTRGLMTAQFAIACLAVLATVLLVMNGRFMLGQDWGYDPDAAVVVSLSDPAQFGPLRDAALGHAAVLGAVGARDHVGLGRNRTTYAVDGEEGWAFGYAVGAGYLETMGLALHHGRTFDPRLGREADEAIVNQRFADEHGWADAIGQTLRIDERDVTIVGVAEDVLQVPFALPQPMLIRQAEAPYRFLVVRTAPEQRAAVLAHLESRWDALASDLPFEGFTQREVFDTHYASWANLTRSVGTLAGLALLIACMGLFGLAAQNASRRRKEVGVRKVLGASVAHIVLLVNRPFLVILTVAASLATVVVYGALLFALSFDVANLMPITPLPFVLAYALVLLTVAVSLAAQSRDLALTNPADVLRSE
ncbi:MAG: ABC transporter permease [Rhodothermales bacterium]